MQADPYEITSGSDVFIGFGQTEATCGITATLSDDPFELKAATVGIPLPHTEVKIIHAETGTVIPVGERGELCATSNSSHPIL